MRAIKIVATIGPATSSSEQIERLLSAGVDVVRLNFSHGSREDHARVVRVVRETAKSLDKHVLCFKTCKAPGFGPGP